LSIAAKNPAAPDGWDDALCASSVRSAAAAAAAAGVGDGSGEGGGDGGGGDGGRVGSGGGGGGGPFVERAANRASIAAKLSIAEAKPAVAERESSPIDNFLLEFFCFKF
jgi:hypothetical protein